VKVTARFFGEIEKSIQPKSPNRYSQKKKLTSLPSTLPPIPIDTTIDTTNCYRQE